MQGFIYDVITNVAGSLTIMSARYLIKRMTITRRADRRRRSEGGAADSNF
ncbi:hypothetical protein ACFY2T_02225 [Streptomyces sp. NPDC001260]